MDLEQRIKASIRDVKDYPRPGILFKDITPILAKPWLGEEITEAMVSHIAGTVWRLTSLFDRLLT
jgi:adenine phosphoribosyltransferase